MSIFQTEEQAELQKKHSEMIGDCMDYEDRLSQWESEFIQSLSEQLEHEEFIALSQHQVAKLVELWNKVLY